MPHVIEAAKTGRAKCRGCGQPIQAGALRFGERVPNPFGDEGGETTHWFHVPCAALLRPEPFLASLPETAIDIADRDQLEKEARLGVTFRRLPRVTSVERASSGRAACRSCREPIPKGEWRLALVYYEESRFVPSGFIHLGCAPAYLETTDLMYRLKYFSREVTDADFDEVGRMLAALPPAEKRPDGLE